MQKQKDYVLAKKVGKSIQAVITARGLTRYNVARSVGIAVATLGVYIRGESLPSLPTFKKLCKALKVTPNDIL